MRCDLLSPDSIISVIRFQSTHLHEVWLLASIISASKSWFQSTHLHEVWRSKGDHKRDTWPFQSTHLHEVWPCLLSKSSYLSLFQSTHLHEVWLGYQSIPAVTFLFQSTHLHEVWLSCAPNSDLDIGFNPHTYMRCDLVASAKVPHTKVSIHTPTWGVTIATVV